MLEYWFDEESGKILVVVTVGMSDTVKHEFSELFADRTDILRLIRYIEK